MRASDFLRPTEVLRRAQDAIFQVVDIGKALGRMASQPLTATERVLDGQKQAAQMMGILAGVWSDFAKRGLGPDALPKDGFGADFFAAAMDKNPFADFLTSPNLGLLREMGADVGALQEAWLEVVKRQAEYQSLLSRAWSTAFQLLFKRLSQEALENKEPPDPRYVMNLWIELGDEAFIDVFKTKEFADAQAAYLNANLRLRQRQRVLLEEALRASELPTRSEVDAAHRAIYTLRKEVKALKRERKTEAAAAV